MKKRMTAILLTIAMLCTLLPAAVLPASAEVVLPPDEFDDVVTGSCGESLTWSLNKTTGGLTIEGTGDMYDYEMETSPVVLPPWYGYREEIKTLTVSDGVTSLGNSALRDVFGLTSAALPDSLARIGYGCFWGCSELSAIELPDNLTALGARAFMECASLESAVIPQGITMIDYDTFNRCTGLKRVTLPDGLTALESSAFGNCSALTEVTIPDTVTTLSDAFRYCTGLTSVTIPGSVEVIGVMAFIGCTGLTSVTIEEGVTVIDRSAFSHCSGLTSVTLPDSVTELGMSAFQSCTGLTSLTLGAGLRFVDSMAFAYCTALKSVAIPDGMIGIGSGMFSGCTALESVTIPVSVKEIYYGAFNNCAALTDVYYGGMRSQWSEVVIMEDNEPLTAATVHFATSNDSGPCGEDLTWTLENGVLTITGTGDMNDYIDRNGAPWMLFRDEITTVVVNEGCTSLGNLAFIGLANLTSVSLPESLLRIGRACFSGCERLASIELPENLTRIDDQAFEHCTSLQSVAFPEGVTSISFGMFFNCDNLAIVTLPESLTSIGESAFYGCWSMTSISIPRSVTDIGNDAFLYCDGLTDVYFGGTAAEWNTIAIGTSNEALTGANIHFVGSCAHEHAYPEHKDATCTEAGYDRMICDDCGAVLSEEVIPALGHEHAHPEHKEPTCTEDGYDRMICDDCGAVISETVLPAMGHDLAADEAVPATCTETGLTAGEHCKRCDYKVAQEVVPMLPHTFKDGVCTVCGAKDPDYVPLEPMKFKDVTEKDWFYDAVNYASAHGLMDGMSRNLFAPNEPMTRAMLVTVLWRYEECPVARPSSFTDLTDGWYKAAVAWAAENGIVNGVGDGRFDPNGNITREQMAAILYRYAEKKGIDVSKHGDLSGFPDRGRVSTWATDAIAWTVAEGIINGNGGHLDPQGNATRAQVATILMRFIENVAE